MKAFAPAKVNLCLFLGPIREDGRHELVTLFESVSLCDELELTVTPQADGDEVVCAGIEGPNLVSRALEALRAAGWSAPPVRIEIGKRIPVSAGMGGGSADAAAALRMAHAIEPLAGGVALRVARELGADVPSQLRPGVSLGTGAGDIVDPLAALPEHALVIIPQRFGLSTPEVYAEADRLGLPRDSLEGVREELLAELPDLSAELLVNELEPAAVSLAGEVGDALAAVRGAGVDRALVCGSGPTVAGIFWGEAALDRAGAAARELAAVYPQATAVVPITSDSSVTMVRDL